MRGILCRFLPALAACALAAAPVRAQTGLVPDVPYVPTPPAVVTAMLTLAEVTDRDFVIDLGSGDGRLLIAAARERGARGFGVEIEGHLVSEARREAQRQGVADRVEFREQNLFSTEFGRASVMMLYLYPGLLAQLRPRFLAELRPGARIVSHDFGIEGWRPDAQVTVPVPDKPYGPPRSEVYLWVVPANAAGDWRWRLTEAAGAVDIAVNLSQTFQFLEGQGRVDGMPARLEEGRMRGDEIRFILATETGGRASRREFVGRVRGEAMLGKMRVAGAETDWKAERVRRDGIKMQ